MSQIILLNCYEAVLAAEIGLKRCVATCEKRDRKVIPRYAGTTAHSEQEMWGNSICGAMGELVLAKAFGCYWPAKVNADKSEPDIEPDWQARYTPLFTGHLIFQHDDRNDQRYALINGRYPRFRVVGWIWGHECRREEWFQARESKPFKPNDDCYFVPQLVLHAFE